MRLKRRTSADPEQVIDHLVKSTIVDSLKGTKESAEHAIEHITGDLGELDRKTLMAVAGTLIIEASYQSAMAIQGGVLGQIKDLLGGAVAAAEGVEKPTDLQEDAEPVNGPQADAEGQPWAEDRR
jgi:hypothetical protein